MISTEQSQILSIFYKHNKIEIDSLPDYRLDRYTESFKSLVKQAFLKETDHMPLTNEFGIYPTTITITSAGKAAYENFLSFIKQEERESEALTIAKEANAIAEKSNKKATHSNIISWIAIGVSFLATAASIVVPILIKIYLP